MKENKEIKKYPPGSHRLALPQSAVITINSAAQKKIAVVYPVSGIDAVILDKNYKESTNSRNYWVLKDSTGKTQVNCETRDE